MAAMMEVTMMMAMVTMAMVVLPCTEHMEAEVVVQACEEEWVMAEWAAVVVAELAV